MDHQPDPSVDDLSVEADGNRLLVRGEIDAHTAPRLGQALEAIDGDVILDLSETDFVDSSGLRVLVQQHQAFAARNASMVIADPSSPVERVFELSSLDDFFDIRHS